MDERRRRPKGRREFVGPCKAAEIYFMQNAGRRSLGRHCDDGGAYSAQFGAAGGRAGAASDVGERDALRVLNVNSEQKLGALGHCRAGEAEGGAQKSKT